MTRYNLNWTHSQMLSCFTSKQHLQLLATPSQKLSCLHLLSFPSWLSFHVSMGPSFSFSLLGSADTCLLVFLWAWSKPADFPPLPFTSDLKRAIVFWMGLLQQPHNWHSCLPSIINVPMMVSFQSKFDYSTQNQSVYSTAHCIKSKWLMVIVLDLPHLGSAYYLQPPLLLLSLSTSHLAMLNFL